MRLYAYEDRFGDPRFGVLVDGGLLTGAQLEKRGGLGSRASPSTPTSDLGYHDPVRRRLGRAARDGDPQARSRRAPRVDCPTGPPPAARRASCPGKVVCVGLNYGDHVAEGGRAAPGPAAAVREVRQRRHRRRRGDRPAAGHARPRPRGRAGRRHRAAARRRVTEDDALAHVAGYVVVNDVSARDWQGNTAALREGEKGDGQWLRAKGSDTFLPVGPVFVTPDELDPAAGLALRSLAHPGSGTRRRQPVADAGRDDVRHAVRRARRS